MLIRSRRTEFLSVRQWVLSVVSGCWNPLIILLVTAGSLAAEPAVGSPPSYRIDAHVEPAAGTLAVQLELTGLEQLPATATLYLHRRATIDGARLDGTPAEIRLDPTGGAGPYMPESVPLRLPPGNHHALSLRYRVALSGMVNDVNTISSALVELALYAAWYPVAPEMPPFVFDVSMDLPPDWTVVSNGEPAVEGTGSQPRRWRSSHPTNDIVILGAPTLVQRALRRQGAVIEIVADRAMIDRLGPVFDQMSAALELVSSWLGPSPGAGRLCVVFPPRGGWGYSRLPMIITNARYAETLVADVAAVAGKLHGNYHELAHFWWMVARTDTTDDWINEALAEYTAWRVVREVAGRQVATGIEARYRTDVLGDGVAVPIVDSRTEPARYVNRYEKGALVFVGLERRWGWEAVQRLLCEVLEVARRERVTTDRVVALCAGTIGREAAAYLRALIEAPGWTPETLRLIPPEPDPREGGKVLAW